MGNDLVEKFPQENYNGEDALHRNRQPSESSMVLEKEDAVSNTLRLSLV